MPLRALIEGYGVGLALIMLIGPVLFVLVRCTLEHGKASGFAVAIGVFVSDIVAVALCLLGAGRFLGDPAVQSWVALAGALILLGFGLAYLFGSRFGPRCDRPVGKGLLAGAFAKGFLVNFVNPSVFMIWLAIIAAASTRHGDGAELIWFMTGCVLGVVSLDCAKVLLAHRISPLLRPRYLRVAFRITGVVLLVFSVRMFAAAAAF